MASAMNANVDLFRVFAVDQSAYTAMVQLVI